MSALKSEEARSRSVVSSRDVLPRLSTIMEKGWELGTFWYTLTLKPDREFSPVL